MNATTSSPPTGPYDGPVVEEEIHLTLVELCRVSRVPEQQIRDWVGEGVLEPAGAAPEQWRFAGAALMRTRVASRLARDFELSAPGVALALDLLDEIESLRARLRRLAGGGGR
jgi:chaperone modulatory protein CbpM